MGEHREAEGNLSMKQGSLQATFNRLTTLLLILITALVPPTISHHPFIWEESDSAEEFTEIIAFSHLFTRRHINLQFISQEAMDSYPPAKLLVLILTIKRQDLATT
jgi:hypothetical protein